MINISIISLICGIIMCVIGAAGFWNSTKSQAKGEGRVLAKIDYALDGIDEIKLEIKDNKKKWEEQSIKVSQQGEQIKSIFKKLDKY